MICFARWGCGTQKPQASADVLADETCLLTQKLQSTYETIFSALILSSTIFIYLSLFWNLGKTIRNPSGIMKLVMPYVLYIVAVLVLEAVLPFLLSNKITVDNNSSDPQTFISVAKGLDFCPSNGTVGTAVGNVGCTRGALLSITDSVVQSTRTFLSGTILSSTLSGDGSYYSAIPILLSLTTAVSAYTSR